MIKPLHLLRFAFLFFLFIATQQLPAQWTYVGGNVSHNNTYPSNYSMAPDTAGLPYVAFADMGNSYIVTVKKLDGFAGWVNVGTPGFITGTGAASGLFYTPGISVAVNPIDNNPWVALADGDNDNKVTVMRYNGTTWVLVGSAGFTPETSCGVKLVFTSDGTAYVVYNHCFNGSAISAMKNSGGAWTYVGAQNFATGNYFNVTASPDNSISVAYQDFDNAGKVSVKKLHGSNWIQAGGAGFSEGEIETVNITSDAAGNLYTCYVDYTQNSKLFVKKLVPGGVWTTLGTAAVSQFAARNIDISVSRFAVPYVSYVDGSLPAVKKFTNNTWNPVGNYVAAGLSYHTSIFNDTLGNPWVFTSLQPSATLPFVLKYSPCNDTDYGYSANAVIDSAITQTGGTTTITVSATGGVAPYTGTGTFVVTAGYYQYTVTDANGCSIALSVNVTEPQPICEDNYWTGSVSSDWNDVNNWSCGSLPGVITTAHIELGAANYPLVNSHVVCKQMIVADGATVTIGSGGHIEITGP